MDEENLDRMIDDATAQLVRHEPSDALTRCVIERIRGNTRRIRPWLLWSSLSFAGAVAGILLVVFVGYRTRSESPLPVSERAGSVELKRETVPSPSAPVSELDAAAASKAVSSAHGATGREIEVAAPHSIEPLTIEAVSARPVEVPPIDVPVITPMRVEITPLTIEPLSASND